MIKKKKRTDLKIKKFSNKKRKKRTDQARQFSSGELYGSSTQPQAPTCKRQGCQTEHALCHVCKKENTNLLQLTSWWPVLAHSHLPSSSISFPEIQNSLRLLRTIRPTRTSSSDCRSTKMHWDAVQTKTQIREYY